MQKIETYQPKEKTYGTIGTLMIKTIETLNPSFSLPSCHQHKVSHCSSKSGADLTIAATLESHQMTEPASCTPLSLTYVAGSIACICNTCSVRYCPVLAARAPLLRASCPDSLPLSKYPAFVSSNLTSMIDS